MALPKPNSAAAKLLADRILARRRLLHFTKLTHPRYSAGWVHDDICRRLERFSREVAEGKSPRLMLLMPPRHGKQLAHNTLVPTPVGMRRHGDLRPGDFVYAPSGAPVQVLAISDESPQDREVEFMDGSRIQCHAAHEWTVYDRARHEWRTVETEYLASQCLVVGPKPRARFQLPLVDAVAGTPQQLPIDPYFLGAWLGDGKSSEPVICGCAEDMAHITALIPYGRGARQVHPTTGVVYQTFVGGIRARLRIAQLLNNKHIPAQYLSASVEQRHRLLEGLVDTDGSVEPGTQRVRFRSGSQRLAADVAALVRSLGYRASVDYTPADTRERHIVGGESWCVQWTPHDAAGGGTLPRKRVTRVRSRRRIGVKAVRNVPSVLGRCIQVDSPDGLYLAGEAYLPTHNSELASIRFPAWHLGQYPHHELINVGYNLDLPMGFSRKVREVFRDPQYQAIFPDAQLDPDSQSVEKWNTTKGGGFTAAGRGGGITGKGAHILIIDDPIKDQEEADSALVREKLWDWYQSTAYTRLAPGGGVLVIQTWWNDDDLAGRLQQAMALIGKEGAPEGIDDFEIIKYPALSQQYEYRDDVDPANPGPIIRIDEPIDVANPPLGYSKHLTLLRPKDFCLHEDRYPTEALKRIRANLQPRIWSALYQQNPVPDEGMYFRKEYFRYQRQLPSPSGLRIYTAWDFAIGEKQANDWTVGATILQDELDQLYVLEIFRMKGDSFQIVEAMLDVATRWGSMPGTGYLLGAEDGQIWRAIEPLFKKRMVERRQYLPYEVLRPMTDKMARARPLQGRMQQGRVIFPEEAAWRAQAEQELLRFPAGVHDDVVDALAWAVQLCMGKEPPQAYTPPPLKSWRDRLSESFADNGTHMSS